MRIGEQLLRDGLITAAQLDTALRTQAQYGGRIGSTLAELGALDLDALALALAKKHGVPAVLQKHCDAIERAVARLLPAKAAARIQAIPLGWSTRQHKTMIVAFLDPLDLPAVDEVQFTVGARVLPCVAPEARLAKLLHKYLGVRPKDEDRQFVRFDPALRVARSEPPISAAMPPAFVPASMRDAPVSQRIVEPDLELPPDSSPEPVTEDVAVARPDPALDAPPPSRPIRPRASLSMPPQSVPMPPAPMPEPPPVSQERTKSESEPAARPESLCPVLTVEEAMELLEAATTRDEVGDAMTYFLAMHFRATLILIVKDGAALGWKGFVPFVDRDVVESVSLPLGAPSLLRTAYETRMPYVGPPPVEGAALQLRLYKLLRCEPPATAVAVPVSLQGRVVNLVYGHGDPGVPLAPEAIDEVLRITGAAALAYVRILRARAS